MRLAETQARLAILDRQRKVARHNHEMLEVGLDASRREHLGECISALPLDDVLQFIFRDVLDAQDPVRTHNPLNQLGFTHYSLERKRAPFTLAAVCRRWRTLAISTTTLWSWISAPDVDEKWLQPVLDSVDLCLVRSRSAPLDVVLTGPGFHNESSLELFDNAVQLVGQHFNRWRTADLQFSRHMDHQKLLQYLRGPSPVLTRLFVLGRDSNLAPNRTYLPVAPNLTVLEVDCTNFRCSPRHGGFRSLTTLSIYHVCTVTQLVELLSACALTLKTLVLHSVETIIGVEGLPINLPALTSLTVSSRIQAHETLIAPVLRTLMIDISVSLWPFLEQVRSTVTELILFEDDDDSDVDVPHLIGLSCLGQTRGAQLRPCSRHR